MEIYVMKKKFVLTLALVLMVAVTLSAATPLEVSGSFKAGYTFTFDSAKTPAKAEGDNKATINAAFAGDFWSLEIGGNLQYGKDKALTAATAKIFLDKALAAEGVDMGDVSLTLHAGTGVGKGAPSVLADKNKYRDGIGVAMKKTDNFGLTIGYAKLVEVYFSMFPNKDFPMVVGAKITPLDGVAVALGFTNDYNAANKAFAVSAKADVKALADLDFDLAVTGEYLMDIDAETSLINADVTGGYAGATLWVAYNTDLTTHKLAAKAAYKTVVEGFTLSAGVKFSSDDLSDIANKYEVGIDAGASYKLGGVTYALDLAYGVKAEKFTVKPSAAISF